MRSRPETKAGDRVRRGGRRARRESGQIAWSIHRLIPIIIEAASWLQDFERAQHRERLRPTLRGWVTRSAARGRPQAMHWWRDSETTTPASGRTAPVRGRPTRRRAVRVRCRAHPSQPRAVACRARRSRRRDARVAGAAHDVFARIRAETELRGGREHRASSARTPAKAVAEVAGALTGREREIARLVAARSRTRRSVPRSAFRREP